MVVIEAAFEVLTLAKGLPRMLESQQLFDLFSSKLKLSKFTVDVERDGGD